MAELPKGLLKSLIKEGYDPPEAMKEAWRLVKVQQKRYGARMSHGGGYPLGYKGKNPAQSLSTWERKWGEKLSKHKTGSLFIPSSVLSKEAEKELYRLSDFVVSSHIAGTIWLIPRKNPKQKRNHKNPLTTRDRDRLRKLQNKIIKLAPKNTDPDEPLFEGGPSLNELSNQIYPSYESTLTGILNQLKIRRGINPVMSGTFAGIVDNPVIISSKDEALHLAARLKQSLSDYPFTHVYVSTLGGEARASILITVSLDPKSEWPNGILENSRYAKFHLGYDGKLEMITGYGVGKMRKVSVKNIEGASAKLHQFLGQPAKNPRHKKVRKNPIAFYNPRGGTLIYGRVLELRAIKTSGRYRGERYRHQFDSHVQAIGLSNGDVLLKSNNGARLWKSI